MKLFTILKPAKSGAVVASVILMLGVSAATLSAFDDQNKERRQAPEQARPAPSQSREAPREAPARSRPAPEAAPSRSAPSPNYSQPSRQERQERTPSRPESRPEPTPSYSQPSRQERAPSPAQPSRQESSPSYTPSTRQDSRSNSNPGNSSPNRQTQTPSYNPPAGRNPNGPATTPMQPNSNTPGNSGGWRQMDRSAPNNAPARGNVATQPNQSGPSNSPGQPGMRNQPAQNGVRNPQSGGGALRLPPGQTTRNNDGTSIHRATDGRVIHMDPRGQVTTVDVRGGGQVHYAPNGRPDRVVTRTGAVVINRPGGARQIVVDRPGRVEVVTNARGQGYIQRPFVVRGHEYYQRTYYVHDRAYVNVYRPYYYGGVYYPVYMPVRYYRPAFYGWAFSPWGRPISYSWGWDDSPWYDYYGPYFSPYPVYRSPLFWLTDFLISATLESGYEQRMADREAAREARYDQQYDRQQAMTPEIKQMVADEVQRQLAQERADGQNAGGSIQDAPRDTLPGIFNDGASHALVVHNPINASDGGQGCVLTEGDVIGFEGNLTHGVEFASVRVLASKGQDCPRDSTVGVSLQDILEMQNNLRETIDRGLGQLQSNSGRNGLPSLPRQAMGAPINSPLASEVPQADPNGAAELNRQAQEATRGEQAVLNEAPPLESGPVAEASSSDPEPTVSLGMTASQVQSVLGPPRRVVDLGQKRMFIYDDMKVIFMDGRVSDVQ